MELWSVCLLLHLLHVEVADSTPPSSLRLVNLLYRHGDRSPYTTYPNNPHNITDNFPQGYGWLTNKGMKQEYSLGRFIRRRYDGFLSASFKSSEVYVESTDTDRCLMSAYCNLAGLYPPAGNQIWNQNLLWQPIPVHSVPQEEDKLLAFEATCPRYTQLFEADLKSNWIRQNTAQNKALYDYVQAHSGLTPTWLNNIWKVSDTLFCERENNISWPSWVNDTLFQQIRAMETEGYNLLFHNNEEIRLQGGPLLKEWIKLAHQKMNDSKYTIKMNMYAAHDSTIIAVTKALKVYNNILPPYSSTLFMELHESSPDVFHIELYYRNHTSTDPNDNTQSLPLTLPGCGFKCPLTQFISLTKRMIPVDWTKECQRRIVHTIVG